MLLSEEIQLQINEVHNLLRATSYQDSTEERHFIPPFP